MALLLQLAKGTNYTISFLAALPLESFRIVPSLSNFSMFLKSSFPTPIIIILKGNSEAKTIESTAAC
jgi:hypothetical protein